MVSVDRGACRSCGAPLQWAITPSGKPQPIDVEPSERGNVLLIAPQPMLRIMAIVLSGDALKQARASGQPLRTAHHGTCPQADQWRKR